MEGSFWGKSSVQLDFSHLKGAVGWQSKGLTWNIPNFLWDREKTGMCGSQIPHPRVPSCARAGSLELLGSFFPDRIPRPLGLSLLFAPIPLENFHPFPLPVFLGFLFLCNVPEQLLRGVGNSLFGIFLDNSMGRDPQGCSSPGKIQMKAKFRRN